MVGEECKERKTEMEKLIDTHLQGKHRTRPTKAYVDIFRLEYS